ncbi:MAG: reverse transcriptase family protein [Pirellulaceae bacterium]
MNAVAEIWRNLSARDTSDLRRLAEVLQLSTRQVEQIPNDPQLSYRSYAIKKRDRRPRHINEPSGALKQLQRRLLANYLSTIPVSWAVTAFRPGMSIATHARHHVNQSIVLTADLVNFFPSTSSSRIRRWFRGQGWDGQALRVLMRLTSYRGALPQGAPTSPALSNLVNHELDDELLEMTQVSRGRYSRYCDDLAFSWSTDCEPSAWRNRVEEVLRRFGYSINEQKGWRLQGAAHDPELTGIAIHGSRLLPSRANASKIRRLRWSRKSIRQRQQWLGYRGFLKMLRSLS